MPPLATVKTQEFFSFSIAYFLDVSCPHIFTLPFAFSDLSPTDCPFSALSRGNFFSSTIQCDLIAFVDKESSSRSRFNIKSSYTADKPINIRATSLSVKPFLQDDNLRCNYIILLKQELTFSPKLNEAYVAVETSYGYPFQMCMHLLHL